MSRVNPGRVREPSELTIEYHILVSQPLTWARGCAYLGEGRDRIEWCTNPAKPHGLAVERGPATDENARRRLRARVARSIRRWIEEVQLRAMRVARVFEARGLGVSLEADARALSEFQAVYHRSGTIIGGDFEATIRESSGCVPREVAIRFRADAIWCTVDQIGGSRFDGVGWRALEAFEQARVPLAAWAEQALRAPRDLRERRLRLVRPTRMRVDGASVQPDLRCITNASWMAPRLWWWDGDSRIPEGSEGSARARAPVHRRRA